MTDLPFLVAGGGIAGLAAALGLSRLGSVRLFEQAPDFEEVGAGLQMSPNGARALQALGAWEAVEPSCVIPAEIHIRDGRTGKLLQRVNLGPSFERRFGAPYRVCHRADLLAGLLEAARTMPNAELVTGKRVTGANVNDGPRLVFTDGPEAAGRAIVAADGIRSILRERICGTVLPAHRGLAMFRALIPMTSVPPGLEADCVTLWLCPGGHVVHYPVSGWRSFNIVAVAKANAAETGWGTASTSRTVLECLPETSGDLMALLRAPASWLRWQGADLPELPSWSKGAMVLTGDAAHATLPFLAQGAVMALEDACVLTRELAGSGAPDEAFARFEKARKHRASRIQRQSRNMGRIYHLEGIAGRARNVGLRLGGSRAVTRQTAWIYDWKPE